MINIVNKENCVGCNACVQRCPVSCITMHTDEQGFSYPRVDMSRCIDCSLCERVCPVIVQADKVQPTQVSAAANRDNDVRRKSSSGGIFYALAKTVITQGGVVFGARFDVDWQVVHDYSDTLDGITPFMGSKYVQSSIGDCYMQAEKFLKAGRKVMFTGTSCQIAGLRLFLRKDYGPQLLAVEVICHGVPSPLVWNEYLSYLKRRHTDKAISAISFRDKHFGWERFCLSVDFGSTRHMQSLNSDPFILGFLKNLYLRPSCYKCPAKSGKSRSDIALGDFWHARRLQADAYRFGGLSLVLAYSDTGRVALSSCGVELSDTTYAKALEANSAIEHSVSRPLLYDEFWRQFGKSKIEGLLAVEKPLRQSAISALKSALSNRVKRFLAQTGINKF